LSLSEKGTNRASSGQDESQDTNHYTKDSSKYEIK